MAFYGGDLVMKKWIFLQLK